METDKIIISEVVVKEVNAFNVENWKVISVQHFLDMPMRERVKLLIDGDIQFRDNSGNPIPPAEALKVIRGTA